MPQSRRAKIASDGKQENAAREPDRDPSLAALIARAERAGKTAPPVEQWNPEHCGELNMVIRADGTWIYQGSPIARPALVRLFSTVLRKDADGKTYLVTPVEKLGITVEDAHFAAVEMSREIRGGQPILTFRSNVGDVIEAGPDHPMRLAVDADGGFKPYVLVRGRLEARLTRAHAFELADWLEEDGAGGMILRSNGARFTLEAFAREG